MQNNYEPDDLAAKAMVSFNAKAFDLCLSSLKELETHVGTNNRIIVHNKVLAEFYKNDMKDFDKYCALLSQLTGQIYPDINIHDIKKPTLHYYNYALLLYHTRYYYQSNILLEKLLTFMNEIKDKSLTSHIILLLMEVYLSRRLPEKTLDIGLAHAETLQLNPEFFNLFERLMFRANMMLGKAIKPPTTVENIEWLFLLAHHHHLSGNPGACVTTLGRYKDIKFEYSYATQGEDIWAAINNNLGVVHLAMHKYHLAVKYFQIAVKEHFKEMENKDSNRLIVCRDRPIYVFNLGIALLRASRPEGAFECLVEAARHYPNNPRIWLRLAECCVKYCCGENSQKLTVKKVGSGPHTKLILGRASKVKYSTTGESFAIPTLSLEFAALCLRNAITLLPAQDPPADMSKLLFQAAPSSPLNWKQHCMLRNSVLIMYSFVSLQLHDPVSALKYANQLLNQTDTFVSNAHKALAHVYAAESLINLDRISEAIEHLNPAMIHDIVSVLPPEKQDLIGVSIWSNAAVCNVIRGDLMMARKILLQIHSPRVVALQVYLEMCAGNIENCHALLRKYRMMAM